MVEHASTDGHAADAVSATIPPVVPQSEELQGREEMAADDVDMSDATPVNSDEATDDGAHEDEVVPASSASASDAESVETVSASSAPMPAKKCSVCGRKKPIAGGCTNNACKKCCIGRSNDCAVHRKAKKIDSKAALLEQSMPDQSKTKKAVLKHEFKENNFSYYGETVAVFCVRDFFQMKRLSQGILNDQTRSQRVSGSYLGKQPRKLKGVKLPELKNAILAALGKRKRADEERSDGAKDTKGPTLTAGSA